MGQIWERNVRVWYGRNVPRILRLKEIVRNVRDYVCARLCPPRELQPSCQKETGVPKPVTNDLRPLAQLKQGFRRLGALKSHRRTNKEWSDIRKSSSSSDRLLNVCVVAATALYTGYTFPHWSLPTAL